MSTYQDIDISFDPHPSTGDVLKKSDVNAAKQWLRHLFLTNPGEIPSNPYYGLGLNQFVFELYSPILKASIIRRIKEQVNTYLTEIVIQDVQVKETDDGASIDIILHYYVQGSQAIQKFFYQLERTR